LKGTKMVEINILNERIRRLEEENKHQSKQIEDLKSRLGKHDDTIIQLLESVKFLMDVHNGQ